MRLCTFLSRLTSACFAVIFSTGVVLAERPEESPPSTVYEITSAHTEGQNWSGSDLSSPFDRLPAKAEKMVRAAVWNLSRDSSGISFRFNSDSPDITIKYTLTSAKIAMPHMPATGVSGVDLYGLDRDGKWKWVSVARPSGQEVTFETKGLDRGLRSYLAYLPLYNGVKSIQVEIPEGKVFQHVAPRKDKPLVFYGTSITHGACASRPGMTHVALLSRLLEIPTINLGFSGNGKMEAEVGALLTEIDAAVYVIDCLPNMNGDAVGTNTIPLVKQIREIRPDTPIILVEDRTFTNAWVFKSRRDHHAKSRAALIRAYDELVSSGVKNLYYLEGSELLGDDHEGATDGSHPNDLGFLRQAEAFAPLIKKALESR